MLKDERMRKEIEAPEHSVDGQRKALLPNGMGSGTVEACKPTWTCSYQYSNGDNCTVIRPLGTWLCRYSFEK